MTPKNRDHHKPSCLWILPTFPFPPVSGGDIRVFYLLKHLSNLLDISIVTWTWGEPSKSDVADLANETGIREIHYVTSKKKGIFSKVFWYGAPHGMNYFVESNMAAKLQELRHRGCYDFVQAEFLYTLQYAKLVSKAPVFLTEHNVEYVKYKRWYRRAERPLLYHLQLTYIRKLESNLRRRTQTVFCTSSHDQQVLAGINPRHRIEVVPNGVELETFKHITSEVPRNRRILFVGSMFYKPNNDAVLFFLQDVFPRVVADWPECQFWIVGKGPSQEIRELADNNNIVLTGPVRDVRPYLEEANVVLVPLLSGSGTRIKILEAMAAGRPVVSTRIGAEGLDVIDGQDILIADTPESLANAISKVFSDSGLASKMAAAGKRMVRDKYTWKDSAEIMASVYNEFTL
jgi:glycosyltransferase involved in cell wall biosynthesis